MRKADYKKSGLIFNIQKFSVNDGPGIRTTIFFKGCPLRCHWCANPESQLPRVQILWEQKRCLNCYHCKKICPAEAISVPSDHIHINPLKCTGCGLCVEQCPGEALQTEGKLSQVSQIIEEVMQDEPFYEESSGGITLSGGEFLMQSAFAIQLLLAAKEKGLRTCCETSGYADGQVFKKVIENIDIIFFDVKHWDSVRHKEGTGVTNEKILSNLKYACDIKKDVTSRIPLIPGYNDSLKDAVKFTEILHKVGAIKCQLLPFHQFGENKYHLLDINYAYEDVPALHREDLEKYRETMVDHGIDAFF